MVDFKELQWLPDRMIWRDYVFRLNHYKNDNWELGDECFLFVKVKGLVDEYEDFFLKYPDIKVDNLFEIGIYSGGSMPFWNELLSPKKHVGIDLLQMEESLYLKNYFEKRKLSNNSIHVFRGVDQSDKTKLLEIHKEIFGAHLDVVIDDASHIYGYTKKSFEAMFPVLRTGGLYIIEDWAWGHWEDFFDANHPWATEIPPTKLISELVELAGSDKSVIKSMTVYQGFTVIERGPAILDNNFTIEKFIKRRPRHAKKSKLYKALRRLAKNVLVKLKLKSAAR